MTDHDLLIRIDERVEHLTKQMDNHLSRHTALEEELLRCRHCLWRKVGNLVLRLFGK